ncbi:hypothetical protein GCM10025859_12490 [Alicyclobacillus fastidiosus]|nr:hypothetical protein GCM10025859_12490 [Alicyclobacillus fastidiosus]
MPLMLNISHSEATKLGRTPLDVEMMPTSQIMLNMKSGREPFPGAGFTLSDNEWDLSFRETRARTRTFSLLRFIGIQNWLNPYVKDFMMYNWMVRNLANSTLKQYLSGIDEFSRFLMAERPDVVQINSFDESVARGFTLWVENLDSTISTKRSRYIGIDQFSRWLRRNVDGLETFYFQPHYFPSPEPTYKTYLDRLEKVIPSEVRLQIMRAIKLEEHRLQGEMDKRFRTHKQQHKSALDKLLFCQILKIVMATGRRISNVINLGRDPLRPPGPGDADGVWVDYVEAKTRQGVQSVFVPAPMSDIVKEAVHTAQQITAELIALAEAADQNQLFLSSKHNIPRRMVYDNFIRWLNGKYHRPGSINKLERGFVHRYNITHNGEIYLIRSHNFRHTRSTLLRMGGAGYGTVKNDLLHRSADMTGVYIHAHEQVAKELKELRDNRELSGKAAPLIENKSVRLTGFSDQELSLWREQGLFVQPTIYGYCVLPQEQGVCPIGDPCWIGPKGDGCSYHLYGPAIKDPMEQDVKLIKDQREKLLQERPNSPLIGHYNAIIKRYEGILEEAINNKGRDNSNHVK